MIGRILGNRYEIIEKIGGGGMAIVYKAKCNLLNRYVAVKILRPEFTNDKEFIDKFKRESQAAASLSHPNIVNVYDVGEDQDVYYIVMEYVLGKTLKELIREKGRLSLNEIIEFSKQIAYALRHAHHNHIIHRDIKPHNILITQDQRAKVTDFGIALAATSSTLTNAGSVIGSVHYFSPEQARGGYTDEKSDLYSLGIVMYEMATGRLPFEGDTPISIALKHIQEQPPSPASLNPELSKALSDLIVRMMQKEQSARVQSTEELLEVLNKIKKDPHGDTIRHTINQEDSPTQIIPNLRNQVPGEKKEDEKEQDTTEEDEKMGHNQKKKGSKAMVVVFAILAALLAALLFTFGFFFADNLFKPAANDVEVPNFVSRERSEAQDLADSLNLVLTWVEKSDNEVDAGYVISQSKPEGMVVREGFTIELTVSTGQRMVPVPDLVFKEEIDVALILKDAKLVAGTPTYESSELAIGTVIRQDPPAYQMAPEFSTVNYVVSSGPPSVPVLMPYLTGRTLEDAQADLENLGLVRGQVTEAFSDQYEAGRVIDQSIPAATSVEEGTVVDLTVSIGPDPATNPEPTDPENGEDNGDEETTATPVTKQLDIRLDASFSGVVDVDVYHITGAGRERVASVKHDIGREGSILSVPVTGTGMQSYEVHVNGQLYTSTPYAVNFGN